MDTIVTTAIVGTGQAGNQGITTNTPVDELAVQLAGEPERQLLLTAGAWAMYRRAGGVPVAAPEAPPVAEPETLADGSRRIHHLIETLLYSDDDLLLEALERLRLASLRLSYHLLPRALQQGAEKKALRAALVPVLGSRGRWLSQLNPAWSWVAQYLTETTDALPADAETIWQEGTQGQRAEILQRLRQSDPAKAREWLTAVWKLEKADARNDFLAATETQLSLEDEPLLEQALDDRSSNVRATAVSLLARLPDSALTRRMQERADAMLSYTDNELIVTLPEKIDQAWERDGITSSRDQNQGERGSWMRAALAQVSPQHWEERFGLTPSQLLDAAVKTNWALELIEGWSYAAVLHRSAHWIGPLTDWWYGFQPASQLTRAGMEAKAKSSFTHAHKELLALLPQREAEQKVLQLRETGEEWKSVAAALPKPWSEEFGHTCLQIVRDYLRSLNKDSDFGYEWVNFLKEMVMALPPACFATALQSWEIPDDMKQWVASYWKRELTAFESHIQLRKRVLEEIR